MSMGIYLPNMEMPKDRGVYIAIDIDGQVYTKPLGALEWQRLEQKAVPVPTHGRLIDADELIAKGTDVRDTWVENDGREDTVRGFSLDMLDHAPTIIPAEPCKEKGE